MAAEIARKFGSKKQIRQCFIAKGITFVSISQRTPWGVEKRGGWKTSRMTPLPKRGFGPPLVRYVCRTPQVSVLCFFLYKNSRQSRPEALLEASKNFRESAFSGTFSYPHTFCTPHITAKISGTYLLRRNPCVHFHHINEPELQTPIAKQCRFSKHDSLKQALERQNRQ